MSPSFFSPQRERDDAITVGERVTWACVFFGHYPQTEILAAPSAAVDGEAEAPGDCLVDPHLFARLEAADWAEDGTALAGVRYRRVTGPDGCRYFRYDPIPWRVLRREGGRCLLLAEEALERHAFSPNSRHVNWAESELRAWLNGPFYRAAFSEAERAHIPETSTPNPGNLFFATASSPATVDRVFLPAEEDVFFTPQAVVSGFSPVSYGGDPARMRRPTPYARCRGVWTSPLEGGRGNCFWFLRTSGYTTSNVMYVDESGDLLNRGCYAAVADAGIVPALCLREA